jgi:hypothetical protein
MEGAEVVVAPYAAAGWPPGVACVVRRVRIRAATISADLRVRRRRTIPKGQLALALDGVVEAGYVYSFIATDLDVSTLWGSKTLSPGLGWASMRLVRTR